MEIQSVIKIYKETFLSWRNLKSKYPIEGSEDWGEDWRAKRAGNEAT